MSWAGRRKFLITASGASLIIFVLALILVPTFYQSPSCTDRSQNQGEEGIDCGGPCSYLCTALVQEPRVRFTKAVYPSNNRVDIIAYVDNPNINAGAFSVPYTLTLYAADHSVLRKGEGTFDLPPNKSVPVFVPGFFNAGVSDTSEFLEIDADNIRWFKNARVLPVPKAENPAVGGTTNAPRVTAMLTNADVAPQTNVTVVAIVYDSSGTVVAASQTLIPAIAPGGSALATFTWGRAFPATPARIEIVPLPTLQRTIVP